MKNAKVNVIMAYLYKATYRSKYGVFEQLCQGENLIDGEYSNIKAKVSMRIHKMRIKKEIEENSDRKVLSIEKIDSTNWIHA